MLPQGPQGWELPTTEKALSPPPRLPHKSLSAGGLQEGTPKMDPNGRAEMRAEKQSFRYCSII